jgi:chromosome segregation ATPase
VALALSASLADAVGAAKIYKWVDEKGVTHYGESIPPEYKDQGATEMSKYGLTVRKLDPIMSSEQRKANEEKALRDREEKQRIFEQRRRDLALVNTYTSMRELEEHRDRTLQMPQQVIKGLEPQLKKAQNRLAGLHHQVAAANKAGKPLPDDIDHDIADQKAEVDALRADVDRNQAQIDAIRGRFDLDRKRYLELTQR